MKMIKIYAVALLLSSILTQTAIANELLKLPTGAAVRAQLWHHGIESNEIKKVEGFDAVVDYPEELIVAIEIWDAEKK
jgi:hypothetical protein